MNRLNNIYLIYFICLERTSTDIKKIATEIISNDYFYDKFKHYLKENKIEKKKLAMVIAEVVKNANQEMETHVHYLIQENIQEIVKDINNFSNLITTLADKGYDSTKIHYMTVVMDVNLEKLRLIYEKFKKSENKTVKEYSSTILGLIGRKSPSYLFRQIENETRLDDNTIMIFSKALHFSSYKPFRHKEFTPSTGIIDFVIDNINSENKVNQTLAISTGIRLFDLYNSKLFTVLKNYIRKSDDNKNTFLYSIRDEKLYLNRQSETSLLLLCTKTESSSVIRSALEVFKYKLYDKEIKKNHIQKTALNLIKKWSTHHDFQDIQNDTSLLSNIADVDTKYVSAFLQEWILNLEYDEIMFEYYYPKLIYNIFKNYHDKYVDFLSKLANSNLNQKFDMIINFSIKEMVFDTKLKFDSELYIHNNATIRDLKKIVNSISEELYSKNVDSMPTSLCSAIHILLELKISKSDPSYSVYENLRKELKCKLIFFEQKFKLLKMCLELLIGIAQKRNIKYEKSIKRFKGKDINSIIFRCEILREFIFFKKYEEILNFDIINDNFQYFPNLVKYFGYDWLEKEYREGPPYHTLLIWLSRRMNLTEPNKIISEYKNEIEEDKRIVEERIRNELWEFTWLRHVEECLGFFEKANEQGKGIIIKGLKDDNNFFSFLSQLEIGIKMKQHGYIVTLEDTSICKNPRVDILAQENGQKLIFEIFSPDLYADLKYSAFAADIPDRAKDTLIRKINTQLINYAKALCPIILVFNLVKAHDIDLHGILYSLRGSKIDHLVRNKKSEIVDRYWTYERDPQFLKAEGSKVLSAVICYKNENVYSRIRLIGSIIVNKSASVRLNKDTISELEEILFS